MTIIHETVERYYVQDANTFEYVTDKGSKNLGDSPCFGSKEERKSWKTFDRAEKWCNEFVAPNKSEFRNWQNRKLCITSEMEEITTKVTETHYPKIYESEE